MKGVDKKVKKFFKVVLCAGIAVMALATAGCGGSQQTLNVFNWGDYINPQVLKDFEKEYNIKVVYEEFDTNEDMYVKIANGSGKYDVAIPSDYMIRKMINEDMLIPIDMAKISYYGGIEERHKSLPFDPDNQYSVPYMWGTVGILYNTTMVDDEVDSWDILWNPKYEKKIFMLNSIRDSIGITLKWLGYSLNTKDEGQIMEARDALIAQKPLVLSYVGDEMKDKMVGGEAALTVAWSGDAALCISENEDLAFAIPKEGSNIWVDSMVIPKTAQNVDAAHLFIDFMCRPEIGLANVEYIEYSSPILAVREELPEEISVYIAFSPGESDLLNSEVFDDLSDALVLYDRVWTEVLAN
jgi:spermidine/putrescine transport system substrate-binding protein